MGKIRSISIRVSYEINSLMRSISKMRKGLLFVFILILQAGSLFAQNNNRIEGSLYPFSSKPDTLFLTSENMTESERFAIQTMMGNLAKTQPVILRDMFGHKEILEQYGIVFNKTYYTDFAGLLQKFAGRFNGYVLCDAKQKSSNVAVSLAGILNAVAIPADIQSKAIAAGLNMLIDVRGKDENWALANYGDQFSKKIATYQAFDNSWTFMADYSVYNNAFQFWDDNAAGSLAEKAYNRMESGATFFGWGPDEYRTIEQLSKQSHMMHPSDFAPNLTTLTNIPCEIAKQKEAVQPFEVVPNKHTVCFVISDGDNVQWLLGAHNDLTSWKNPNQRLLNLGWTISPSLVELAPTIYNKYVNNMQSTAQGRNLLIAGPSGRGYFFPGHYADLAAEAKLTNRFMKKADLGIVNVIDEFYSPNVPESYLSQSNIDAIFYYLHSNYSGLKAQINWVKDKPSIGGRYTLHGIGGNPLDRRPGELAAELNKASTNIHSEDAYSLIPVHIWTVNVDGVLGVIKDLGTNVRVVDPEEFVWLMRKNLKGLPMGSGIGLKAEYFSDTNFETPGFTQTDSKINFNWNDKSPLNSLNNQGFSVRWSGEIQPLYSEEYTFFMNVSGGAKLSLNNHDLFNTLSENPQTALNGKMVLEAGKKYSIEVEYNHKTGSAFCELKWESNSHVRQTVPKTQLYSEIKPTKGISVTAYSECGYKGFSGALKIGNYTLTQLNALGIKDNEISSVQLQEGFKVVLYENDQFGGESLVLTSGVDCLGNSQLGDKLTSWDKAVSSLKVMANGAANLEGLYYLQNLNSNLYLDVVGGVGGKGDGINIQQWNPTKRANQEFKLSHLGNGLYSVIAMHSLKSLDVANMDTTSGANLRQLSYFGSANQQFIIYPTGSNSYKLIARHSGKLVDVANSSKSPEANVIQFTNNGQNSGKWKLVPAEYPMGEGDGLKGNYYNGMNFQAFKFSRVDPIIDFNWGEGSPDSSMPKDGYSVRWTGQIQPLFSGIHTFYINSDNGRRLWVNNQLIIDKWISDWDNEYTGTISLAAGKKYDIKLEYFEDAGGASCKLEWSSDQVRTVVPKTQLFSAVFTGITNLESGVSVFPNPVKNTLFIGGLSEAAYLIIYTGYGHKVLENSGMSIDVESLPAGLYILMVNTRTGTKASKFIKQ